MRLVVSGRDRDSVVDAALVDIGSGAERFAAHRSTDAGLDGAGPWSVTHVATGFRIASGRTAAAALATASVVWKLNAPEERAAALAKAREIRAARQRAAIEMVLS